MRLTLDLNFRFLWVDRYCVSQDDPNKHGQISKMHQIYAEATATLVATGSNDTFPLPGVSVDRRDQYQVRMPQGYLLDLTAALEDISVWTSRGWTMQEAFSSRQLIYITRCCVVIAARKAGYHTIAIEPPVPSKTPNYMTTQQPIHEHQPIAHLMAPWPETSQHLVEMFTKGLSQYSKRNLTFESDALHACRGFLNQLPFPTLFGVPVLHTGDTRSPNQSRFMNDGFDLGLSWTSSPPAEGQTQRASKESTRCVHAFPTWSWASSRINLSYTSVMRQYIFGLPWHEAWGEYSTLCKISMCMSDGTYQTCDDFFARFFTEDTDSVRKLRIAGNMLPFVETVGPRLEFWRVHLFEALGLRHSWVSSLHPYFDGPHERHGTRGYVCPLYVVWSGVGTGDLFSLMFKPGREPTEWCRHGLMHTHLSPPHKNGQSLSPHNHCRPPYVQDMITLLEEMPKSTFILV